MEKWHLNTPKCFSTAATEVIAIIKACYGTVQKLTSPTQKEKHVSDHRLNPFGKMLQQIGNCMLCLLAITAFVNHCYCPKPNYVSIYLNLLKQQQRRHRLAVLSLLLSKLELILKNAVRISRRQLNMDFSRACLQLRYPTLRRRKTTSHEFEHSK